MTKIEEYIKSLTDEEKNYALLQFYEWYNETGCPMEEGGDDEFECDRIDEDSDDYCDENYRTQIGCWLRFYVWKFRKMQKKKEDQ